MAELIDDRTQEWLDLSFYEWLCAMERKEQEEKEKWEQLFCFI